jgi:hypothetical protein
LHHGGAIGADAEQAPLVGFVVNPQVRVAV